jgi:N6-adenosine-specific RNA methylase IME4
MGFWYRNQIEELWFCTDGEVRPPRIAEPNVIEQVAMQHSSKPDAFRAAVFKAAGKSFRRGPQFVELFARENNHGMLALGLEIDGLDIRVAIKNTAALIER